LIFAVAPRPFGDFASVGEIVMCARDGTRRFIAKATAAIALIAGVVASPSVRAAESVTYLFPAPPSLPAFGPIQLAKGKGYFAQAGLDVNYAVGRGGVDVAKQVGAGNAPLGGIVADGPIMVRQNGVPIKIVTVFGGKGFMQLVAREDSGIQKPSDLKGKTISVMSFQDTTFYALLGLLASAGLSQDDVKIQSAGPAGVWEFVATGKAAAMAGVPDWIPPIQAAGVKVKVIPSDEFFPHMAQGIGVSDQVLKEKPELVRKFVTAALRGMKDIMDDPNKAAEDFVRFVPEWQGKEGAIKTTLNYYAHGVSGAEAAWRGQCRAAEQPAGLLPGEGHHPAQIAARRALHQPVHPVRTSRHCRARPGNPSSSQRKSCERDGCAGQARA
jgi:NitT/TauT family transport system substrate-binding protein